MDKKIIFLLIPFFFVFVAAIQPTTTQTNVNYEVGLQIQTQGIYNLQQNADHTFSFHVYNISTGMLLDNTTVSCGFHLFNKSGKSQYHLCNLPFSEGGFEVEILGTNFSNLGSYSYYIHCNSSEFGGFTREQFEVTYSGEDLSESSAIFYIVLFMVFIFLFSVTILGINKLPYSNGADEEGKLIKISYLKYLRSVLWFVAWMLIVAILYVSSNIAFAYLEDTLFANFLFVLFRISFVLTLPIIVIWFIWILARIVDDKKLKGLWERGIFPQQWRI